MRRIIYTTNAIEALNSKIRRAVRTRDHFLNDDAAMKLLYLVLKHSIDAWKRAPRKWFEARAQFAVMALVKEGTSINEIARKTGHSRNFVRRITLGKHPWQRTDVFCIRQNALEIYLPWLETQWQARHRNAADLWRRLKDQGFRGCLRSIGE